MREVYVRMRELHVLTPTTRTYLVTYRGFHLSSLTHARGSYLRWGRVLI